MSNKELIFILTVVILAAIVLLLADDFNKRLGIQEEKINKLTNGKEDSFSFPKNKIGFVTS